jgi:hypothetical protein
VVESSSVGTVRRVISVEEITTKRRAIQRFPWIVLHIHDMILIYIYIYRIVLGLQVSSNPTPSQLEVGLITLCFRLVSRAAQLPAAAQIDAYILTCSNPVLPTRIESHRTWSVEWEASFSGQYCMVPDTSVMYSTSSNQDLSHAWCRPFKSNPFRRLSSWLGLSNISMHPLFLSSPSGCLPRERHISRSGTEISEPVFWPSHGSLSLSSPTT